MPSSRRPPAPPRTPAGGINPAPTANGEAAAIATVHPPCRGRFYIGPVHTLGGYGIRPYQVSRAGNVWISRLVRYIQNDHRAGCPHPAGPLRRREHPREGHGPPPVNRNPYCGRMGNCKPHDTTYLCRGRCLHRPAGPCVAAIPRFARNIKFIRKNKTNPSRLQPTARRKSPGLCTGRGIWRFCPVSGYSAAFSCAASPPRIWSSRIFLMFSSMWKLLSSGIYRISSVMLTGSQKLVTTSTSGESG